MSSFHIRLAIPNDLDNLVALENECFTLDRISRKIYLRLLKKNSTPIFIVEDHDKIVGCVVMFYRKNSPCARMYSLAVKPDFRKFGLAKKLCSRVEEESKMRRCTAIFLEVRTDNAVAIHFYHQCGYEVIGKYQRFYEDGSDALRMKKNLCQET